MSTNSTADRTVTTLRRAWRWLVRPVWNRDQRRLRAPLRALVPLVLSFLALAALQPVLRARFDHPVVEAVEMVGLATVLAGTILVSGRLLDRRLVAEYGLALDREWWRAFAVGAAIATAVNAVPLAVALATGWATVSGFAGGAGALPFPVAMLLVFGYLAVAAAWEEFVFRAALLKNLAEGSGGYLPQWAAVGLAVVASSAVFAFLHGGKVTEPTQYGYYLLAGLVFGCVYVLTGELALPIGFHAFYNFTLSAVFGLGVSQQTPELIVIDVAGPAFWLGEAGMLNTVAAALGGLGMLAYVRRRDGQLRLADRVTRWDGDATSDSG